MMGFVYVSCVIIFSAFYFQVGLALLRALLYVARPATCKLGKIPESTLFRDTEQYPGLTAAPGVLAIQLGSPIYYANCNYIRER